MNQHFNIRRYFLINKLEYDSWIKGISRTIENYFDSAQIQQNY